MKILVTGHKGYIGTILAPMLIADGQQVVGCDSDLYRNCTFGEGVRGDPRNQKGRPRSGTGRFGGFSMASSIWRLCQMTPWGI